ncbi:hypothetical protein ES703_34812 [subsurface metagenome]
MDQEAKITHCPNCGGIDIHVKGKEVLCADCNCLFKITAAGPKVKKIGVLDSIHSDIEQLKAAVFKKGPDVDELDENNQEPQRPGAEDDDDLLPGFFLRE